MPYIRIRIPRPYGVEYEVFLTLRKKGGTKNELTTNSLETILEYLASSFRIEKETIIVDRKFEDRSLQKDMT